MLILSFFSWFKVFFFFVSFRAVDFMSCYRSELKKDPASIPPKKKANRVGITPSANISGQNCSRYHPPWHRSPHVVKQIYFSTCTNTKSSNSFNLNLNFLRKFIDTHFLHSAFDALELCARAIHCKSRVFGDMFLKINRSMMLHASS